MSSMIFFSGSLVATLTTTAKSLKVDPKRCYRFVRMECVRSANGGTPANTMQGTVSAAAGLANAAASLTTYGHLGQNAAAAAPGTMQDVVAASTAERWFAPNTGGLIYFYPFPDVLGDTFTFRVILESRPMTLGGVV